MYSCALYFLKAFPLGVDISEHQWIEQERTEVFFRHIGQTRVTEKVLIEHLCENTIFLFLHLSEGQEPIFVKKRKVFMLLVHSTAVILKVWSTNLDVLKIQVLGSNLRPSEWESLDLALSISIHSKILCNWSLETISKDISNTTIYWNSVNPAFFQLVFSYLDVETSTQWPEQSDILQRRWQKTPLFHIHFHIVKDRQAKYEDYLISNGCLWQELKMWSLRRLV